MSTSNYQLMPDRTLVLNRTQQSPGPHELFDVFSTYWTVGFATLPPEQVSIRTRGGLIKAQGDVAFLAPPFSLINYVFHGAFEIEWSALIFDRSYPTNWPTTAIAFQLPKAERPSSFNELVKVIEAKPASIAIDKIESNNVVALRTKHSIDRSYTSEKTIQDYAEEVTIHADVMSRYFKQTYGMSPLDYRTQLRLWHSMWTLVFESPRVTDVAHDVGFRSLKNFYTLFSKYTSQQPGQFRLFDRVQTRAPQTVKVAREPEPDLA